MISQFLLENLYNRPYDKVVIVETREADCIFRSATRGDGIMEVDVNIITFVLIIIDVIIYQTQLPTNCQTTGNTNQNSSA